MVDEARAPFVEDSSVPSTVPQLRRSPDEFAEQSLCLLKHLASVRRCLPCRMKEQRRGKPRHREPRRCNACASGAI